MYRVQAPGTKETYQVTSTVEEHDARSARQSASLLYFDQVFESKYEISVINLGDVFFWLQYYWYRRRAPTYGMKPQGYITDVRFLT